MFRNQFVACLKVQGQILREDGETVRLPFGSEYTLFLRNYNSRRAVVKVEIDGQDVLDGRRLVVNGNSHLELERFIKDGDLSKGNRFRFIHKDEKIQQHRGDRVDDGIVRVSWQYERPAPTITWHYHKTIPSWPEPSTPWYPSWTTCKDGTMSQTVHETEVRSMSEPVSCSIPVAAPHIEKPRADEGITVAGSVSTQQFGTTCTGLLEHEVHVIILKLLGTSPVTGQAIEKPLTVKDKLECPTCGTKSDSRNHFCGYCGTCLGD